MFLYFDLKVLVLMAPPADPVEQLFLQDTSCLFSCSSASDLDPRKGKFNCECHIQISNTVQYSSTYTF